MTVSDLIRALQEHDREAEVIGEGEELFEISEVVAERVLTGRRVPTDRPGVYDMERKSFVVIR